MIAYFIQTESGTVIRTITSARRYKRVHFQRDSIPEDVRIIGYQEPYQQQEQQHRSEQQAINLYELPPLFRCKTYEEIHNVVSTGKGAIGDIFRGCNALHWYCDAKSTSPGIIQTLLNFGVDIDALDQRKRTRGTVIRHTAWDTHLLLNYNCSDPTATLPEYDDPHLWPGIDYLLETFWRFFYPLAICTAGEGPSEGGFPTPPQHLTQDLSETVFVPFGGICDMLLETVGYEKYESKHSAGETRGQIRLISLIAGHPEFESFWQGKYVDVDSKLKRF
ncbi:hypothetical protein ANO14919_053910 [Xylariales sp. No.14919]|nr:hypothetical protein ANO14919_053910 [Xylariales sp. No.14919]